MNKEELFASFKSITGSTNDIEVEQYLEACAYDLPTAVDLFYARAADDEQPKRPTNGRSKTSNGQSSSRAVDVCMVSDDDEDEIPPASSSSSGGSQSASHKNGAMHDDDTVRAPMQFHSGPIISQTFEQQYGTRGGLRNGGSVFSDTRDFRAVAREQEASMRAGRVGTSQNGSVRSLHALFMPPVDLIFDAEWEAARNEAQARGLWLLVNIQDMTEFASQTLNRDVWSNVSVKEMVRANFLFWQGYEDASDGARIKSYYEINKFPAIFIVDPRTGEKVHSVPLKTQDPLSLCDSLSRFIDDFPDYAARDRAFVGDAAPMVEEQPVPDQAKGEDVRSVRKRRQNGEGSSSSDDQSKSKKLRFSESDEVDGPLREEAENMRIVDKDEYLKHIVPSGSPVKVLLKFPDGTRHTVDATENTTIKALFIFISGMGLSAADHSLVMAFPKREFHLENSSEQTLKEAGFTKHEMLHVELK